MPIWRIGSVNPYNFDTDDGVDREVVQVIADSPHSLIVGVIDIGNHTGLWMACDDIANQARDDGRPTPLSVAAASVGRGATLQEVMPDGTLRGWRGDDDESEELTLDPRDDELDESKLEPLDEEQEKHSRYTGPVLKVTTWEHAEGSSDGREIVIFEGDPDTASGLPDGSYGGESPTLFGSVLVRDGRIVAMSS